MFLAFVSPLLPNNEKTSVLTIIHDKYKDVEIATKISEKISIRIVSHDEIMYLAKQKCLTITPLCIKHMAMKSIHPCTFSTKWKVLCNLFLYNKKVVFLNLSDDQTKRYTAMVNCMGGSVSCRIDSSVNYVIAKKDSRIPSKCNIPVVAAEWIETLFYQKNYVHSEKFMLNKGASLISNDKVKNNLNHRPPLAEKENLNSIQPLINLKNKMNNIVQKKPNPNSSQNFDINIKQKAKIISKIIKENISSSDDDDFSFLHPYELK